MYPDLPYGVSKIKMDLGLEDEGSIGVRMYLVVTTPSFEIERVKVAEHSTQGLFEYSQFTEMCELCDHCVFAYMQCTDSSFADNYNVYVGKATGLI
jgi:hypothetical protein